MANEREALEMVKRLEDALAKCRAHVVCHVSPAACCSFEAGGEVFSALQAASLAANALNDARDFRAPAPGAPDDGMVGWVERNGTTVRGADDDLVMVPRVPTEEMIEAAWARPKQSGFVENTPESNTMRVWQAMVDAAPPRCKGEVLGWIISSGDGKRFRVWRDGATDWTEDRYEATRYARRQDAEAVHAEDDDAWGVHLLPAAPACNEGEGR